MIHHGFHMSHNLIRYNVLEAKLVVNARHDKRIGRMVRASSRLSPPLQRIARTGVDQPASSFEPGHTRGVDE